MLRPTFLSFETAKRALSASQRGLDTVGHNISNVNTPGYTRQRVDQVSLSSGGYKTKYQVHRSQFSGQGSDVIGISQIRDPFLDKRYRTEAATAGEQSAISEDLAYLNSIFDEILKTGAHAKLTDFINAIGNLATTADSVEMAAVLRTKAEQFASVLNKNYKELEDLTTQLTDELRYTISDVNTILENIAYLNVKIKEDHFYGNPSLELTDQRNLLIDQLSELIEIDVKYTPVEVAGGMVIQQLSIEIKGSGDASKGIDPIKLVDSGDYNGLKLYSDVDGTVSVSLVDGISGFDIVNKITGTSDISDYLFTGAIKGHMDVLNGKGTYAVSGEKDFQGIPYYKQMLDDYAREFAHVMNELNKVEVWDDVAGEFKTLSRPLFTTDEGDDTILNITAKNLTVSKEWKANADYITKAKTNNALYTDPSGQFVYIDEDGVYHGTGITFGNAPGQAAKIDSEGYLVDVDGNRLSFLLPPSFTDSVELNLNNLCKCFTGVTGTHNPGDALPPDYTPDADTGAGADNLNAMKLALTDPHAFGKLFPGSYRYTGSFQEFLVNLQSQMASDKEINDALLDASIGVLYGLANSRDAVSAVSIDEEGINMMTYQNYYNAAARYMTVLDEALGTIIQGMGVVGR